MPETVVSHGIEFVRVGACNRCGACGCGKIPCPHLNIDGGGQHTCAIYDTRAEYCHRCGSDHRGCAVFPDNPWIGIVRSGLCGFSFGRADGGSMDSLPFLRGEPYWLT